MCPIKSVRDVSEHCVRYVPGPYRERVGVRAAFKTSQSDRFTPGKRMRQGAAVDQLQLTTQRDAVGDA
jgi:hypothetical protein